MDTDNDEFPLHTAAREGRRESRSTSLILPTNIVLVLVAEGLLKNDPRLSKQKDDDGRYAVHWAASSNSLDIVLLLANQKGFDPDVQVNIPCVI